MKLLDPREADDRLTDPSFLSLILSRYSTVVEEEATVEEEGSVAEEVRTVAAALGVSRTKPRLHQWGLSQLPQSFSRTPPTPHTYKFPCTDSLPIASYLHLTGGDRMSNLGAGLGKIDWASANLIKVRPPPRPSLLYLRVLELTLLPF